MKRVIVLDEDQYYMVLGALVSCMKYDDKNNKDGCTNREVIEHITGFKLARL